MFTQLFLIIFGVVHLVAYHLLEPLWVRVACDLWVTVPERVGEHEVRLHAGQVVHGALLGEFVLAEVVVRGGVYHARVVGGEGLVTDPAVLRVALVVADDQRVQVAVHVDAVYVRLVVRHVQTGGQFAAQFGLGGVKGCIRVHVRALVVAVVGEWCMS